MINITKLNTYSTASLKNDTVEHVQANKKCNNLAALVTNITQLNNRVVIKLKTF